MGGQMSGREKEYYSAGLILSTNTSLANKDIYPAALRQVYFLLSQFWFSFYCLQDRHPAPHSRPSLPLSPLLF